MDSKLQFDSPKPNSKQRLCNFNPNDGGGEKKIDIEVKFYITSLPNILVKYFQFLKSGRTLIFGKIRLNYPYWKNLHSFKGLGSNFKTPYVMEKILFNIDLGK